jgi:peptidoglycan/LPS O-acetylase OafA/YrhL
MNYIIILFSAATIVAGIIIVINPETVFGLIRKKSESLGMHILAVVVRIIIGVALIMYATESKYPTAILFLGWLSIVAASVLGIMGRTNFRRLMSWSLRFSQFFGRIGYSQYIKNLKAGRKTTL